MAMKRGVRVVDMHNGVVATSRIGREHCATDGCLDPTVKNSACRGYAITVAEDDQTTANRPAAQAVHYNDVWRTLTVPGNPLLVKLTETILSGWQAN